MQTCEIHLAKRHNTEYKKILGKEKKRERSDIKIEEKTKNLKIYITATDNSALRASINAVMRDISSIESSIDAVKGSPIKKKG
jgi:Transcription factor Pcc1.